MEISTHAQMMSQLCASDFALLVLAVPGRYSADPGLSKGLIAAISHADKMAATVQPQARAMIFELAERLLHEASACSFATQKQAVFNLIRLLAHASAMSLSEPDASVAIFATIRPLMDGPIPSNKADLNSLDHGITAANTRIRELCHQAQMQRAVKQR